MSQDLEGNTRGLKPSEKRLLTKLYRRRLGPEELVTLDFAREIYRAATEVGRKIGVLISRDGDVLSVVVGSREIIYLPDLGRYRLGRGRLRRVRLLFSDLSNGERPAHIPADIYGDLQKLRFDAVVAIREKNNRVEVAYAHLVPPNVESKDGTRTIHVEDLGRLDLDFSTFMEELEGELQNYRESQSTPGKGRAVALGVYATSAEDAESSMAELSELARTAGVEIVSKIIQRKAPDPKTVVGKGRLEDAVLQALRLDADLLIFDCELSPGQWRVITNSTELKVIDRSMLILDIFAQRAKSSEGRMQVELAQLKFNLPRLQEKDGGMSRLTGGIGGRGPGETKMEIGKRRIRDRIVLLDRRIQEISAQRGLRRKQRQEEGTPLVAIVGYTNAGKSTLFNSLTGSNVLAEDRLFATLDTTQRRIALGGGEAVDGRPPDFVVMSDTVGFIRELPNELVTAFRATLEELYSAELVIHLIDSADPEIRARIEAVDRTLTDMGLSQVPVMRVLSKIDLISEEKAQQLARELDALRISSKERKGLSQVREQVRAKLFPQRPIEGDIQAVEELS